MRANKAVSGLRRKRTLLGPARGPAGATLRLARAAVGLAAALLLASPAPCQDWPQWRGPARDGVAPGLAPQTRWPAVLAPAWRVSAGIGHSAPVVVGPRVYLFAREGDDEVLRALDRASGKAAWRQSYPAPYALHPAASAHGKGPKSTPAVAAGRVFTLGISGILSAHDAASGRLLWRHDVKDRFRLGAPLYGASLSPAVDADRVFVHLGGENDGALFALDAATGATRWTWAGDGPGYASPVVATLAGVRQVVTQTQRNLVGLSAESGALLWKLPFTTAYEQNAVTPVVSGELVIYSGLDNGVRALRVVSDGAAYAAQPVWENPDTSAYMSTPVLAGGVLFGLSHKKKGQFFALDAASGRTLWLSEGRQGDNASLVAAGDALLLLTTESKLIVANARKDAFSVVRSYTVAETPTWAHVAVAGAEVLVKDRESLALFRIAP